jgi:hypothetical protein
VRIAAVHKVVELAADLIGHAVLLVVTRRVGQRLVLTPGKNHTALI